MNPITDLALFMNASTENQLTFSPDKRSYRVEVPTDCFGLLLKLSYEPDFYISITADKDAGRFGFGDLNPEMGDYIAGNEIPYYEYYDGYIIRLDKREFIFDSDLDVNVTIRCGSSERGEDKYEIVIHRDSGKAIRDLFREGSFYDEEFEITMPYELYVPTKYDKKKKYPLVISLHGTGEIQEPVSALLKKTQMATAFAEDSEKGANECLVLAPQCRIRYDEDDNWTTLNQFVKQRTDSPFWPMPQLTTLWKLLEQLKQEYRIDDQRIYLTGVSSGAFGIYVLAMEHPDVFAALVPACGAANPARIDAIKHTPVWVFHAEDDPLIVPEYTLEPTVSAMEKAGMNYRVTRYPKGQIFWQSAHFCWEAMYKNEEMRRWLFEQRLGGVKVLKQKLGMGKSGKEVDHSISKETDDIASKAIKAAGRLDAI